MLTYKENQKQIELSQLDYLYTDVQWFAYTQDFPKLQRAIEHSLDVYSAWDGEKLVGLIRTVGDGLSIIYIQDILILKDYQNKNIGTELLQFILNKYNHVRQKVLLTDESPDVRHFYEKNGLVSCDRGQAVAFMV